MKPAIYRVLILIAVFAIPVVTLNAQSTGARFTVPFDFIVNGYALPAGDYFVEGPWWKAVAFHHAKGEANLIVLAQYSPRTQETQSKLIIPSLWRSLHPDDGRAAQHQPRPRLPN